MRNGSAHDSVPRAHVSRPAAYRVLRKRRYGTAQDQGGASVTGAVGRSICHGEWRVETEAQGRQIMGDQAETAVHPQTTGYGPM